MRVSKQKFLGEQGAIKVSIGMVVAAMFLLSGIPRPPEGSPDVDRRYRGPAPSNAHQVHGEVGGREALLERLKRHESVREGTQDVDGR